MLIARLIADPATLETRLDAATRALAAADMPVAEARMLDACSEVLELEFSAVPEPETDSLYELVRLEPARV